MPFYPIPIWAGKGNPPETHTTGSDCTENIATHRNPSAEGRDIGSVEADRMEANPVIRLDTARDIGTRAILLFFILSTPVENTYVDEANYASLGSTSMFDAIRGESIVTTLANYVQTDYASVTEDSLKKARRQSRPKNNVNTLKPVAVKTEKIAAAPRVEKQKSNRQKHRGQRLKRTMSR